MEWLYLVGRVLFSLLFISSGFNNLTGADTMAAYASSKGVPAPKAMVLISGLMLLLGGLSVLLGFWMEIGTWLLVLFLIPAAFKMHDYWDVEDPGQKSGQRAQFMKNISLAGAALMLYTLVQVYGYGPLTIGSGM